VYAESCKTTVQQFSCRHATVQAHVTVTSSPVAAASHHSYRNSCFEGRYKQSQRRRPTFDPMQNRLPLNFEVQTTLGTLQACQFLLRYLQRTLLPTRVKYYTFVTFYTGFALIFLGLAPSQNPKTHFHELRHGSNDMPSRPTCLLGVSTTTLNYSGSQLPTFIGCGPQSASISRWPCLYIDACTVSLLSVFQDFFERCLLQPPTISFIVIIAVTDIKPYSCRLRPKGHAYKLPECSRDLYKKSFVPRCLFRYS